MFSDGPRWRQKVWRFGEIMSSTILVDLKRMRSNLWISLFDIVQKWRLEFTSSQRLVSYHQSVVRLKWNSLNGLSSSEIQNWRAQVITLTLGILISITISFIMIFHLSGVHEIRDSRFCGRGFAPDFYRSFELDCEFPNDSLLSLGIASS